MEIDLYAVGYCVNNGKSTQRSSCGALLIARDQECVRSRRLAFRLSSATTPQADLHSAYMALAAVQPEFRQVPVRLFLSSQYGARMLQRSDGQYVSVPQNNERLIGQLRRLSEQFPRLVVQKGEDPLLVKASDLARSLLKSGGRQRFDSGTTDGLPED